VSSEVSLGSIGPLWLEVEHIEHGGQSKTATAMTSINPATSGQLENFNAVLTKYADPFVVPIDQKQEANKLTKMVKLARFEST
jgi:hypothetical protein